MCYFGNLREILLGINRLELLIKDLSLDGAANSSDSHCRVPSMDQMLLMFLKLFVAYRASLLCTISLFCIRSIFGPYDWDSTLTRSTFPLV